MKAWTQENKKNIPFLQSEFETVGRVASCNLSGVGPPPQRFPQPVTTQFFPVRIKRICLLSLEDEIHDRIKI